MGSGGSRSHEMRQPYAHFHDLMENVKNVFVLKIMRGTSTFFCPAYKLCVNDFLDFLKENFKKMFVFTAEIALWQHDNIEWGSGGKHEIFRVTQYAVRHDVRHRACSSSNIIVKKIVFETF